MRRMLIHVEGQTEEMFVKEVLAPHFWRIGFESVQPRLLGNVRLRSKRGGIRPWSAFRKDITRHLLQDTSCVSTTMVDYYGLPEKGDGAWPGRAEAKLERQEARADFVERRMYADVLEALDSKMAIDHFVPYVMIHEFEALLFSDCRRFAEGIFQPELSQPLQEIRDNFVNPEAINDSPESAPSKRIQRLVIGYNKVLFGNLAAAQIGLEAMRAECPHFDSWILRLESLLDR